MKATLLVRLVGPGGREPGSIVEGEEAIRLIAAGLAQPIKEPEMAVRRITRETATIRNTKSA